MVKRSFALAVAILLSAVVAQAQPIQSIQFGTTVEILNTTSTGSVNGNTYALPTAAAAVVGYAHFNETAPSAVSVSFQASFDGVTFFTLTTSAGTAGPGSTAGTHNTGVTPYRYIRAIQGSRTGGTRTTVTATVLRAYPISSSPNPNPLLTGHLLFSPSGTWNVGSTAAGGGSPNHIWSNLLGFNISGGGAAGAYMQAQSTGNIVLYNASGTDFGRLQFGGTTSAFPAWKRLSTTLQARTADDTADVAVTAGQFQPQNVGVTIPATTGVTALSVGTLQNVTARVTVSSAAFTCAALTCDVIVFNIPSRFFITNIIADLTQVFACSVTCTSTTLTFQVGNTVGGAQLIASGMDADNVAAIFGDSDGELGTALTRATAVQAGSLMTWAGAGSIYVRITSGTGNIGTGAATNLSQGSMTLYLSGYRFP